MCRVQGVGYDTRRPRATPTSQPTGPARTPLTHTLLNPHYPHLDGVLPAAAQHAVLHAASTHTALDPHSPNPHRPTLMGYFLLPHSTLCSRMCGMPVLSSTGVRNTTPKVLFSSPLSTLISSAPAHTHIGTHECLCMIASLVSSTVVLGAIRQRPVAAPDQISASHGLECGCREVRSHRLAAIPA